MARLAGAIRALAIALAVLLASGSLAAGSSPAIGAQHSTAGASDEGAVDWAVAIDAAATAGPVDTAAGPAWSPGPQPIGSSIPSATHPARLPDEPTWGTTPPPDPNPAREQVDPARVIYRLPTKARVVALTFDDGWSPANGHRILDILLYFHVKATFFVNSVYVRRDPELWRSIAAAGFPIANHTYHHRDLTTLTTAEIVDELQRNAAAFRQLTGYDMLPMMRPPYGARTAATDAAAALAGCPTVVLWNVVAGDTYRRATDSQMIRNAIGGRPGSIVLMHIGPDATPRILARIIASYRLRGFTFVTIPELLD
jgi:peptidoglycan/xylan/chitin deacetylase (PgdA/CDA1 family)